MSRRLLGTLNGGQGDLKSLKNLLAQDFRLVINNAAIVIAEILLSSTSSPGPFRGGLSPTCCEKML